MEAYAAVGHDAYPCRGIKELPGQGGLRVCGFAPILQVLLLMLPTQPGAAQNAGGYSRAVSSIYVLPFYEQILVLQLAEDKGTNQNSSLLRQEHALS